MIKKINWNKKGKNELRDTYERGSILLIKKKIIAKKLENKVFKVYNIKDLL